MMQPALVILGTRADPHVERVARELERRGAASVVVLDYLRDTRFALEQDSAGRGAFHVNGTRLPDAYVVWDRMKILPGTELYVPGDDDAARGYAAQEWRAFYRLLCGLGAQVVNSLASRACMIKPYQQAIAASVGFRVPPTLISNDKQSVQVFHREHERVIMKSVSAGKVGTVGDGGENIPYVVMTMQVAPEDLAAATAEELAYCPHFFQREIAKSHELRVVYVEDQLRAFRIESQRNERTALDWRKAIEIAGFSPTELDAGTAAKVHGFMQRMGLFMGSLDLIVDPDGQVWFLECNQDGAWGWLDDLVDGAVTRMFADGLTKRLRC